MYIIVRTDLGMGKGKLAAQVAHAACAAVLTGKPENIFEWYLKHNQGKVVLKVSSEAELEDLYHKAIEHGIEARRIHDAGHTQIASGSFTCISLGPDTEDYIAALTGKLKLL